MGITEAYDRGRKVAVDRPLAVVFGAVGLLLAGDLLWGSCWVQSASRGSARSSGMA